MEDFAQEVVARIQANAEDESFCNAAKAFMQASAVPMYYCSFAWQGRPIIQQPQDISVMQELIWSMRPDLIIQKGIAHCRALICSASTLALLDVCASLESQNELRPSVSNRNVLGIDIEIRSHNHDAVEAYPMELRNQMIERASVAPDVVREIATDQSGVLVCLYSNHTHEHVFAELEIYAPLATQCSYRVVFNKVVKNLSSVIDVRAEAIQ